MKIDDRGRIGGKISLIDIAIILIVLIVALGLVFKFLGIGLGSGTETITYQITAKDIRGTVAEMLRDGDKIWVQGGGQIGVIKGDPVITGATQASANMYGDWGDAERPIEGKYDVTFIVEAEAAVGNNGRNLVDKSYEVIIGRGDILLTKYASMYGTVTNILSITETAK